MSGFQSDLTGHIRSSNGSMNGGSKTMTKRLTAQSTLGDWLKHPVGRPLFLNLLEKIDQSPSQLGSATVFPLNQLMLLSNGKITEQELEELVYAADAGSCDDGEYPTADNGTTTSNQRNDLTLDQIQIRDPFILRDDDNSRFYLYGSTDKNVWFGRGTGFEAYTSPDLQRWEGPFTVFSPPEDFWSEGQFWAPEVHKYRGSWYMFATFTAPNGYRGTQILRSGHPLDPFLPWSDGAVTRRKWQCLDGTLFIDDNNDPWIVFCHEWTQIHDGAILAQRLSEDLKSTIGTPTLLFNASDAPWSKPMQGASFEGYKFPVYITDGPYLYRLKNGHLVMLWSSFGDQGYAMGIAHSDSAQITGPWTQEDNPLWPSDGGHGMIFRIRQDQLGLTIHHPNSTPDERAVIRHLSENGRTVHLQDAGFGAEPT
ncbi:glycoside hydrolase family 43 protein [Paenarthrobacter nicotinovorans]|uniref:glycoside hydrolase family 43 protein n=1 Tax=Paenarthrobacter nicotinovorans TaxID=29320 RepID=UPI003749C994